MTIIKIAPNDNGSHDNQTINGVTPADFPIPEGYAVIPEVVGTPETLENYPFGEIETALSMGNRVVTKWTPLPIPDPGPAPEPTPNLTDMDKLAAAYLEGVNEA